MPPLLPWLAILGLLILKPNRGWYAWWVWLPLGCVATGWVWLHVALSHQIPNDIINALIDGPRTLAFGVAALWLMAPWLGGNHRLRSFARMLGLLTIFSASGFIFSSGWDPRAPTRIMGLPGNAFGFAAAWADTLAQMTFLALLVITVSAAIVMTGVVCGGRYRRLRLWFWLAVMLSLVSLSLAALAYGVVALTSQADLSSFISILPAGLLMTIIAFFTLMPFLLLSLLNPLFDQRLKLLFHME